MSDSLWHHGLQHARPPCPSPTPGAHPNPCPLSRWCHPTISSSAVPFSSCHQSFPASECFPISWLFTLGGQRIGASVSASVLPLSIQSCFPLTPAKLLYMKTPCMQYAHTKCSGVSSIFIRDVPLAPHWECACDGHHCAKGKSAHAHTHTHAHTYMTVCRYKEDPVGCSFTDHPLS